MTSINNSKNVYKNEHEHMLARPQLVIGNVGNEDIEVLYLSYDQLKSGKISIEKGTINTSTGLVQVFLEIISNCIDNSLKNNLIESNWRGKDLQKSTANHPSRVDVVIGNTFFNVTNYGIPFDIDYMDVGDSKMLIPFACYYQLRVGSNFESDDKPRIGIGRNGYGAKTAVIYSDYCEVISVDITRKRAIKMVFSKDSSQNIVYSIFAYDGYRDDNILELIGEHKFLDEIEDHISRKHTFESILRIICKNKFTGENISHKESFTYVGWSPSFRTVFKDCSEISLHSKLYMAKICYDFTLSNIPINYVLYVNNVMKYFIPLPPTVLLQYGSKVIGAPTNNVAFSAEIKDIRIQAIFFDTPKKGVSYGFVNGLSTNTGIHINEVYHALLALFKNDNIKNSLKKNSSLGKLLKVVDELDLSILRRHVSVLVYITGTNPSQDSQTKKGLFEISGKKSFKLVSYLIAAYPNIIELLEKISKWSSISAIYENIEIREVKETMKDIKTTKISKPGYVAANICNSNSVLFIGEGLSVGSHLIKIIEKHEPARRDYLGSFPLTGVPKNIFDDSVSKILTNTVLRAFISVTNLDVASQYNDGNFSTLKYGHFVIATDADEDGYHICGLLLAMFQRLWPGILKYGRLSYLKTPVVRIFSGGISLKNIAYRYFSEQQFLLEYTGDKRCKNHKIEYYKGLGSVSDFEIEDDYNNAILVTFILDITTNNINFITKHITSKDDSLIDISNETVLMYLFGKSYSSQRKLWITNNTENAKNPLSNIVTTAEAPIVCTQEKRTKSIFHYCMSELSSFQLYSLKRALPDVRDGFKFSLRKIIDFVLTHTNYGQNNTSFKVAEMIGDVTKYGKYHHGEASLYKAIVKFAQNYIGSNNIPLLLGRGQFGTRFNLGKDAASARYIKIMPPAYLKKIFHKENFMVVSHTEVDGESAEHEYLPCDIPLHIINGVTGIATGWKCDIPPHSISEVITWLREKCLSELDIMRVDIFDNMPEGTNLLDNLLYRKIFELTKNDSILEINDDVIIKKSTRRRYLSMEKDDIVFNPGNISIWYRGFEGSVVISQLNDEEIDNDDDIDDSHEDGSHEDCNSKDSVHIDGSHEEYIPKDIAHTDVIHKDGTHKDKKSKKSYTVNGKYTITEGKHSKYHYFISEIPPKISITSYLTYLESLSHQNKLKNLKQKCTAHGKIHIEFDSDLKFTNRELLISRNYSLENYHFFDDQLPIKYDSVYQCIEAFYKKTITNYREMKAYKINQMKKEIKKFNDAALYTKLCIEKTIDSTVIKNIDLFEELLSSYGLPTDIDKYVLARNLTEKSYQELLDKICKLEHEVKVYNILPPEYLYYSNLKQLTTAMFISEE